MPQKSTKHKTSLQPSKHIDLLSVPGKATGWTASNAKKPKDTPRPSKEVTQDPASKKLALGKPKARSTTVPQKSAKPKEASKFFEELGHRRDSKGKQIFVRSKPPSTTKTPSLTKHKDASHGKSKGLSTRRDRAGMMTEGSVVEEAADGGGAAGPEAAEREDSVDGDSVDGDSVDGDSVDGDSVDGDSVDGDSVDGDSVDGSTVDKDGDGGQTDEEDTNDKDAVGVHTGGRGPAAMGSDGGDDGGEYDGHRIVVEEEVSEAHAARRVAPRRDDAFAAGVEAPASTELVRRGPGRTRQHDPRLYADGAYSSRARQHDDRDYTAERHLGSREHDPRDHDRARRDNAKGDADRGGIPIRESNRRDPHRRELVGPDYVFSDDDSPAIVRPGFERRVADHSILDRMPPLEVGDDSFFANRSRRFGPGSVQSERQQMPAPSEFVRNWSPRERVTLQRRDIEGRGVAEEERDWRRDRLENWIERNGG